MKMISPLLLVILSLIRLSNVHCIEDEGTKTVIVPITQEESAETREEPTYTLFDMPSFDGEQIYKDVSEKMASVVEEFSSKVPEELPSFSLGGANGTTTLTKAYNYLPDISIDTKPLTDMYNALPDINISTKPLTDMYNSLPEMNLNAMYDTVNSINFEPVKDAASDIVAILPVVTVLAFYGLALYFVVSLLFRVSKLWYLIICDKIENKTQ